jgi:RNA polymerase sigma-70 factor (ECF subfamily)
MTPSGARANRRPPCPVLSARKASFWAELGHLDVRSGRVSGDPGDRTSRQFDALVPAVYTELRRLAHHYMRGERKRHTLQTTALVHEAYLRLTAVDRMQFRDRGHFVAMAATMMRRILVDHARARGREKHGGRISVISLDRVAVGPRQPVDLMALDEALEQLARMDEQQAKIVELRFFGGLTIEETAGALGISAKTVTRDWAIAKAWLHQELTE